MTRRRDARAGFLLLGAVVLAAGCTAAASAPQDATALDLTGDLRTHDPALVVGGRGEPWVVHSTGDPTVQGGAVQVRTSSDGLRWDYRGTVWGTADAPGWIEQEVPGATNLWAPELVEHDGTWYLYYSVSTFGSNASAIGLATSPTLDPDAPGYGWTDRGVVIRSEPGVTDWNAIDPGVVEDGQGTPWMAFGSFWGGIQVVELAWPGGQVADGAVPTTIASRGAPPNAIEAPYLVERDGWFFLFVSKDSCCQGVRSTYNVVVGRSRHVTGPFVDADGVEMLQDGGTRLLSTDGAMIGPGGQSYSRGHLAYHFYDGDRGGDFRLAISGLGWDSDGWPVAAPTAAG